MPKEWPVPKVRFFQQSVLFVNRVDDRVVNVAKPYTWFQCLDAGLVHLDLYVKVFPHLVGHGSEHQAAFQQMIETQRESSERLETEQITSLYLPGCVQACATLVCSAPDCAQQKVPSHSSSGNLNRSLPPLP
ncbi:MAG: hypothetical protein Ct9H300mP16_14270 [Pseudomonadota bacterium]|nr:MAG: hypothetical protein Ct9H300mP16_14270 [Pseudomonadota bacterium]